jgi:hypothetical protein
MSQSGRFDTFLLPPGQVIETIQGNTGGPVGPNGSNNIFVVGDGTSIDIAGNPGTHTLTVSVIGGDANNFPTDSGTAIPAGGILNINAGNATQISGSTVLFTGSGDTVQLNVTDANANTIIGFHAGNGAIAGIDNVVLGEGAARSLTSGSANIIIGEATGFFLTIGSENTIVGEGAGEFLIEGESNTLIGHFTGKNYTNAESSNICVGADVLGTVGESNVLRIGNPTGSGSGSLNQAFICGIDGVNVGSTANIVTEVGNQLGTAVLTAGKGIAITPTANVITIASTGIFFSYIDVNSSPYTVLTDDVYLSVDSTGGPITILFPDSALSGEPFIVKDRTGTSAVNNITITTVSGLVTIDGVTSFIMDSAYQAISLVGNGTSYEIY